MTAAALSPLAQIRTTIGGVLGRGSTILVGTNIALLMMRIVTTMVLSRLLNSAAFGLVGIVTTATIVVVMISDLGFYPFILRHKSVLDDEFLDQVWTVRLIRSVGLTAGLILVAKPVELFTHVPGLQWPLIAASSTLLLEGLSSMAFATAARERKVLSLSLLDGVPTVISTVGVLVLAYFIRSYWALIIALIFGAALKTIASYAFFPNARRRWNYNRATAQELWHFGKLIMPSSIMTLLISQGDKIILARAFDLPTFGLYVLASNLAGAPVNLIGGYTSRILYPEFVTIFHDFKASLKALYYEKGRYIRWLFAFASGGFIACGPIIIASLYDHRYQNALIYFSILSFGALVQFNISVAKEIMVAYGRLKSTLVFEGIRLGAIAIFGLGLYHYAGAIGLVYGLMASLVVLQLCYWVGLLRIGALSVRQEALFYGIAVAGFGVGRVVNMMGFWLRH